MHNYKDLKIWPRSIDLATSVYRGTKSFPKDEQFGLTLQMRRSVVSVGSNIAEGAGRKSNKEFAHFLSISYGSLCELETQIQISINLNYIDRANSDPLMNEVNELQKMIYTMIKKLDTADQ